MMMERFFSLAGDILSSGVRVEGDFPSRRFVAWWEHERGLAEFDGREWSFKLDEV
jgi:hypothetical protein